MINAFFSGDVLEEQYVILDAGLLKRCPLGSDRASDGLIGCFAAKFGTVMRIELRLIISQIRPCGREEPRQ